VSKQDSLSPPLGGLFLIRRYWECASNNKIFFRVT
jgi:hypothetical protein